MIRDAYCIIRTIDQTIPDEVLDFMRDASIEKLNQALRIHASSNSEKLYSVDDIHKIIRYMNKNYSKTEDELARPYEDKGEELPDDFF